MCVSNFKDHKFTASTSEAMLAKGIFVGAEVVFQKRITAEWGTEKPKHRADVNKGTHTRTSKELSRETRQRSS